MKDTYDAIDDPELVRFKDSGQLQTMGLVAGEGLASALKKQGKPNAWGIRDTNYYYFEEKADGYKESMGGTGKGGWGSESSLFQDFITELIAFGGGDQAASEIAGVAEKGKLVTVLLGVKNGAKIDGEAELKVRAGKLGDSPGGKQYVEGVKASLEKTIAAGGDEKTQKANEKLLKIANKALAFSLSEPAKNHIKIVNLLGLL